MIGRLFSRKKRRASATAPEPLPVTLTQEDHDKLKLLLSLVNERSQPNINLLSIATRNIDLIALNIKALGYDLARTMADALPVAAETRARDVDVGSKLSTQRDIESDWLAHWCRELRIPVIYHRKIWELGYVLQALHHSGNLRPGKNGLGFGCGNEPMASYFASLGLPVTITDLPPEDVRSLGWAATAQHAASIDHAYHAQLVDRARFDAMVRYRHVDMNAIPADLVGYDFCWSLCAFEHLGSIEQGLAFVENSLAPLKPGGTAVHTTEFNINADGPTIDNWPTVLFQRAHIEALAARLAARGHRVAPLDFDPGDKPLDRFIDLPPWHDGTFETISRGLGQPLHLKVAADGFISTCFGITVTKAG